MFPFRESAAHFLWKIDFSAEFNTVLQHPLEGGEFSNFTARSKLRHP